MYKVLHLKSIPNILTFFVKSFKKELVKDLDEPK